MSPRLLYAAAPLGFEPDRLIVVANALSYSFLEYQALPRLL